MNCCNEISESFPMLLRKVLADKIKSFPSVSCLMIITNRPPRFQLLYSFHTVFISFHIVLVSYLSVFTLQGPLCILRVYEFYGYFSFPLSNLIFLLLHALLSLVSI